MYLLTFSIFFATETIQQATWKPVQEPILPLPWRQAKCPLTLLALNAGFDFMLTSHSNTQ